MVKLLGAGLLLFGASALGFAAASYLRARAACLRALAEALAALRRELSYSLSPMPTLVGKLAANTTGPAGVFFSRCRAGMDRLGEKTMRAIWDGALKEACLPLEEAETEILRGLGGVLGRYDAEGQCRAIDEAQARLSSCAEKAEAEQMRLGQVYRTMGVTAGAFLVLLLL